MRIFGRIGRGKFLPLLRLPNEILMHALFSHASNDVLRVSGRIFFSRSGLPTRSFRFRKRIKRLPGRRSEVCDNTLLGICVSRRNAVSAGKGRKALQLIED